jgi:hypothetical protein
MTTQDLRLEEVKDKRDLLAFIRFPWQIYKGNPYWVPPLIKDYLSKFSPDHPFSRHADMVLLLAKKKDQILGRITGIIDRRYVEFHEEKTGFFGFFESIEDHEVAHALLSGVCDWLRGREMTKVIGPMNPSTNDECGLLIDGFDMSPCLMMPYNPLYYASFFETFGLKKVTDLYAYWLDANFLPADRLMRISQRLQRREPQLKIRSLDLRHFDEELRIIKDIYNNAWSKNWGFVPMTDEEIDYLAKTLKPLVIPELISIATWEEEPVAFCVSLRDYNQVLRHLDGKIGLLGILKFLYYSRKIRTLRVMLLGVKQAFQKRGAEVLLYLEAFRQGVKKGCPQAECSWILENNLLMQRGLEGIGGKRYKTYRIYGMPL